MNITDAKQRIDTKARWILQKYPDIFSMDFTLFPNEKSLSEEFSISSLVGTCQDEAGNVIKSGTEAVLHAEVANRGIIIIGKDVSVGKDVFLCAEGGILVIEDGTRLVDGCRISALNGAMLYIGRNCIIGENNIIRVRNSLTEIRDGCTFCEDNYFSNGWYAHMLIDKDCMFSRKISIRCTDGHNYVSLSENMNLAERDNLDVIIHEHVWVSEQTMIRYGADVGPGSIIGAKSLVTGIFPENSLIYGIPAKIKKNAVSWVRDGTPFVDDMEQYYKYDFRKNEEVRKCQLR